MPIDAASWYDRNPDRDSAYQGDILSNVPVVFIPPTGEGGWLLLRPDPQHSLKQVLSGQTPKYLKIHPEVYVPDAWHLGGELVFAKAVTANIMVVTQTCDIANRKFIQVAPVMLASELESPEKRTSLRINEINYMFYLPADPGFLDGESYADLSRITAIHISYLERANLVERLTTVARLHFQNHLSNLHGRPFGFNVRDKNPQTAEYVCMNCVIGSGLVQRQRLNAGTLCPPCPGCGEDALWTKVSDVP